jgi:hypothetical protein
MMRKLAVSAALSAALTGAALLVGANPAAAWTQAHTCASDTRTAYGYLFAFVAWSSDYSVETSFLMDSTDGNPIKSESFVRLFFSDGHTKDYRYTQIDDETSSGGGLWYSNPVNHPGVTKLMFHTYIGPDSNVWGCEEWVFRP